MVVITDYRSVNWVWSPFVTIMKANLCRNGYAEF